MLKKYTISLGLTIKGALEFQQKNSIKCLVVVDKKNRLIGTLSDGDIRKAILKNKNLNNKIDDFVNRNPYFCYENDYKTEKLKRILIKDNFPFIPILNKSKKLISIFDLNTLSWKSTQHKINAPVVIMAGGKGTRLQPSTHILPKPLIPLKGKAIIEHIIDNFSESGINNFFLSLNYKSILIKTFFSELQHNYKIKYLIEKKPLGTAGGLKLLQKENYENFIVINCDTIIKINFNKFFDFHKSNKNDISIIGSLNKIEIPYGVCEFDKYQKLIRINEKPKINYISNTGCYLINKKILKLIPKNQFFDFTNLIEKAIKKKYKVSVYPVNKNEWIDAGTLDNINNINI